MSGGFFDFDDLEKKEASLAEELLGSQFFGLKTTCAVFPHHSRPPKSTEEVREEVRELDRAHFFKSRSDGKSLAQAPGRQVMCILRQVKLTTALQLLPSFNFTGRMTWILRTKSWPPLLIALMVLLLTWLQRRRRALPRL